MWLINGCCSYSLVPQRILLPHNTWTLPIANTPSSSSVLASYKSAFRSGIVTAIIATSCLISSPATARAEFGTYEWELMNGSVVLKDPIVFQVSVPGDVGKAATSSTVSYTLTKPKLIGAGGGGAVFSFENSHKLLKVSWKGSSKSVERECSTLQLLERNKVESSERCLGKYDYNDDNGGGENRRVMILAEPYVPDAVASIMDVDESKRDVAVEQIARTLIQMLAANIVTIDVQPLISKETGRVIFIDMTEAQELKPPFTFLAKTLMSSFTTEMMALIPEQYMLTAVKAAMQEIKNLEASGVVLSPEAMDVLRDQTSFIPS